MKREAGVLRGRKVCRMPILNMIVLNLVNISLSRAHAQIRPPYSTFTLFTNLSGLAGCRPPRMGIGQQALAVAVHLLLFSHLKFLNHSSS